MVFLGLCFLVVPSPLWSCSFESLMSHKDPLSFRRAFSGCEKQRFVLIQCKNQLKSKKVPLACFFLNEGSVFGHQLCREEVFAKLSAHQLSKIKSAAGSSCAFKIQEILDIRSYLDPAVGAILD